MSCNSIHILVTTKKSIPYGFNKNEMSSIRIVTRSGPPAGNPSCHNRIYVNTPLVLRSSAEQQRKLKQKKCITFQSKNVQYAIANIELCWNICLI